MLAGSLDTERVGVIGYSAGGETALILAGAQPSPSACAPTAGSGPKTATPAGMPAN